MRVGTGPRFQRPAHGHLVLVKRSEVSGIGAKLTVSNEGGATSPTVRASATVRGLGLKGKPTILKRCSKPAFNFPLQTTVSWGNLPKGLTSNCIKN